MPHKPLVAIIGVIAVGAVTFFVLQGKQEDETRVNDLRVALVSVLRDRVEGKAPHDEAFTAIHDEKKLSVDTTVSTGAEGRALIETSSDRATVVDHNTTVVIATLDPDKDQTKLQVIKGDIWSRVERSLDIENDESFEVETRNTVATVRGTSFWMRYLNGETFLLVHHGAVYVWQRDPETGERISVEPMLINAGYALTISGKQGPIVQRISDEHRAHAWFKYNIGKEKIMNYFDTPTDNKQTIPEKEHGAQSEIKPTSGNTTRPSPPTKPEEKPLIENNGTTSAERYYYDGYYNRQNYSPGTASQ